MVRNAGSAAEAMARPGSRPRNRRQLILTAATELFAELGYPAVGMADIARAVSVQPSALYRHFPSKQDLLREAVRAAIEPGTRILAESQGSDLDQILRALAAGAVGNRHLGVLWQRESRHLPADQRAEMRAQIREVMLALRAAIQGERQELGALQAELLAWCVFAVLISVAYQDADLARTGHAELLYQLARGVIATPLPELTGRRPSAEPPLGLSSRREKLLAAAMALFSQNGYEAVAVDDIAAAAGIATPTFYHHFNGKTDLLWTALTRANEATRFQLARALRTAEDATDGLARMMGAYIDLALDCPEIIEAVISQVSNLQPAQRQRAKEIQVDLQREWLSLLQQAEPAIGHTAARARMHAALTVVHDIACTRHLRETTGVGEALRSVTSIVLLGQHPHSHLTHQAGG